MYNIATIGNEKFTIGFNLCGIKDSFEVSTQQEANKITRQLLNNKQIGLVIIEAEIFNKLRPDVKNKLLTSVSPMFIVLSEGEKRDDSLRLMIKKAIGVDLLK
ncbi:MAG: hypothetical protein B6U87_02540 [Candidatus Aenigmarchaeota archaeon ex4484_52]|nr:MAG: hypothetical protein B6U87_02540 [Candidatus Aenigmarchaeota archaeon ex4484_52]